MTGFIRPDGLEHGSLTANGIEIHYESIGAGPLVVFCHGWPESWYSWRHQLSAVADAGFRAVAMHMRGYGDTTSPNDLDAFSISHLIGDVVAVVHGLGEQEAVVVGHDWGAPVAWYATLMRPDIFRAVAALSVPFLPPTGALPDGVTVSDFMRLMAGEGREYYRLFFQEPGVAEADLERDVRRSMLGVLYTISGDSLADGTLTEPHDGHFPDTMTFVESLVVPEELPAWLTEADLKFYVDEITRTGFRGGLNWYRNIDKLPGILAPWFGATIDVPSFYMGGSTDLIAGNTPDAIAAMQASLTDLRRCELLDGAGHWLQQERPAEVTAALVEFLRGL
ncbi:MAG: alpha/beta hydrolase [Acidimicrobiales bacterium]|nr:alpha/beta hydrolase [Acidimicrobiales bacterium]